MYRSLNNMSITTQRSVRLGGEGGVVDYTYWCNTYLVESSEFPPVPDRSVIRIPTKQARHQMRHSHIMVCTYGWPTSFHSMLSILVMSRLVGLSQTRYHDAAHTR